jgi:triosephosphate isomerase
VLCIGETLGQRRAGETDAVNAGQLRKGLQGIPSASMPRVTIAYEPVWAIGTGVVASEEDAQAAHKNIRQTLDSLYDVRTAEATRIVYGGSLKPSNAKELLAQTDIDGGLVGGASLKASEFGAIVRAAVEAAPVHS